MLDFQMMPYVGVFPEEQLAMDSLMVYRATDQKRWGLPKGEYLLVELHCVQEKCKCRRVMINIVAAEDQCIMATVLGEWESRALKMTVQLDPLYLQSAYAPQLLEMAEQRFFSNPSYVRQLKEHARKIKEKLNTVSRSPDFKDKDPQVIAFPQRKQQPEIDPLEMLELKISLLGTAVWRRFQVPANIDLESLHRFIQDLMGWENYHLWQYSDAQKRHHYGVPHEEDSFWGMEIEAAAEVQLGHLLKRKGAKLYYEYDFGDSWQHEIVLERRFKVASGKERIMQCLEGAMACPPEDCGGVWGYSEILAALKKPKKMNTELKEWLGDYDPEAFDLKALNKQIRSLLI